MLSNDRNEKFEVVVTRMSKYGWRLASASVVSPVTQIAAQSGNIGQTAQTTQEPRTPVVSTSGASTKRAVNPAKATTTQLSEKLLQASKIVQETRMPGLNVPSPALQPAPGAGSLSREIIADGATLRSGPSRKEAAITYLSKGEKIEVIGTPAGGWCKVHVHGKQGYVYGELIGYRRAEVPIGATARSIRSVPAGAAGSRSTIGAASKTVGATAQVVVSSTAATSSRKAVSGSGNSATIVRPFNIHDVNHKPIAPLKVGEHVTVIGGLQGNRYKIQLPNGMTGYVDQNALNMSGLSAGTHTAGARAYRAKTKTAAKASATPQFVP